ncbi:MAG: hypothetical protein ACYCST_22015, partial [Acidimicrobiales bacterium]
MASPIFFTYPQQNIQRQVKDIVIYPEQKEHYERILGILKRFWFYLDGTLPGGGKTHLASAVSKTLNLPILVFAPKTASMTWTEVITDYGLATINLPGLGSVLTYDCLSSMKNIQPKHGLLQRIDNGGSQPTYLPTSLLNEIIKGGVLIIFDEFQKLKNTNAKHYAAKAIIQHYNQVQSRSRIGLLSGSILDKEEMATNTFRLLGFLKAPKLYARRGGKITPEGLEDIFSWARMIDPEGLQKFLSENQFIPGEASSYIFNIFIEIFKPQIMSIMPIIIEGTLDVKNGYYKMPPKDEIEYNKYLDDFKEAVQFDEVSLTVNQKKEAIGDVITAVVKIQNSKAYTLARKVHETLNAVMYDSRGNRLIPKVVVFANYNDVIDKIMYLLSAYKPIKLVGDTKKEHRNVIIKAFQEPNPNFRLLV